MTLSSLCPLLQGSIFASGPGFDATPIRHIVASDLMSDVLVTRKEDFLLVTSLASDQMVRTADLVGATGIVLVNGKPPPPSLVRLAKELDISLVGSPLPKYETCVAIGIALQAGDTP